MNANGSGLPLINTSPPVLLLLGLNTSPLSLMTCTVSFYLALPLVFFMVSS